MKDKEMMTFEDRVAMAAEDLWHLGLMPKNYILYYNTPDHRFNYFITSVGDFKAIYHEGLSEGRFALVDENTPVTKKCMCCGQPVIVGGGSIDRRNSSDTRQG